MFVLIVTASVPTLQPLFRTALGLRSTARYASYSLRLTPPEASRRPVEAATSSAGGWSIPTAQR